MELSLNAKVNCTDGPIGESMRVVINPVTNTVTHVTVRPDGLGESEHLVPIEAVSQSTPDVLELDINKAQFFLLPLFESHRFLDMEESGIAPEHIEELPEAHRAMDHAVWPFVTAEGHLGMYADVRQIPQDELAVHRGAKVESTDGRVGEVSEFVINPDNAHITHLVLRKGHIFDHHDIAVPVGDIDRVDEGIVYLKIDNSAVMELPTVDIKR